MENTIPKNINNIGIDTNKARNIVIFLTLFSLTIYGGFKNFLLFHTGIELISIAVAFNIFSVSLATKDINHNFPFIVLGIGYLFIGGLDLLHTLSYDGLGVFKSFTTDLPTKLWIASRYVEGLTFLIMLMFFEKGTKYRNVFFIYMLICLFFILSIFVYDIFPSCHIKGKGLTDFKVISEYIICFILLVSIIILTKIKDKFLNYTILKWSIISTIISELSFTLYVDVYGFFNILGHIFKLISFLLLYKGICDIQIKRPYSLLNRRNKELQQENFKRLNVEKELLNKREILNSILDSSGNGILVYDNNLELLHVNDSFINMLDVSKSLITNKKLTELHHFVVSKLKNPKVFSKNTKLVLYSTKEKTDILRLKNNRTLRRYSYPLIIDKKIIGRVVNLEDITDKFQVKKLKDDVKSTEKLLKKEKEYDKLKTEFFSNISHELKTPINILLGTVQLFYIYLKNNTVIDKDNKLKEHIDSMKQNCYRLLRLINNLVDITKLESGHLSINLNNYNIVSVVEDITLSVSTYVENKGLSLIFDTDIEEKIIACDPDKIERIILNLLSNGIKFTNPGGEIIVSIQDNDDLISISVKDNGIGIPKKKQKEIFNRFDQVGESLSRNYQGSGIGLSLVKSLVDLHNGSINLISEYNDGSEFIINLPVRKVYDGNNNINIKNNKSNIEKIQIEFSDIYS